MQDRLAEKRADHAKSRAWVNAVTALAAPIRAARSPVTATRRLSSMPAPQKDVTQAQQHARRQADRCTRGEFQAGTAAPDKSQSTPPCSCRSPRLGGVPVA